MSLDVETRAHAVAACPLLSDRKGPIELEAREGGISGVPPRAPHHHRISEGFELVARLGTAFERRGGADARGRRGAAHLLQNLVEGTHLGGPLDCSVVPRIPDARLPKATIAVHNRSRDRRYWLRSGHYVCVRWCNEARVDLPRVGWHWRSALAARDDETGPRCRGESQEKENSGAESDGVHSMFEHIPLRAPTCILEASEEFPLFIKRLGGLGEMVSRGLEPIRRYASESPARRRHRAPFPRQAH